MLLCSKDLFNKGRTILYVRGFEHFMRFITIKALFDSIFLGSGFQFTIDNKQIH